MEILQEFGVNPLLLGAQVVNFLIIFYLLKRFMYKPVLQTLKNRENTIKEGLKKAEETSILLEKTKEDEKIILKHAQANASKLIEEAKIQAEEIEKRTEQRTKIQAEKMVKDAQEIIQRETKLAQDMLARQVSVLAVEILKKALVNILTDKSKKEIMGKALESLQKRAS